MTKKKKKNQKLVRNHNLYQLSQTGASPVCSLKDSINNNVITQITVYLSNYSLMTKDGFVVSQNMS